MSAFVNSTCIYSFYKLSVPDIRKFLRHNAYWHFVSTIENYLDAESQQHNEYLRQMYLRQLLVIAILEFHVFRHSDRVYKYDEPTLPVINLYIFLLLCCIEWVHCAVQCNVSNNIYWLKGERRFKEIIKTNFDFFILKNLKNVILNKKVINLNKI